LIDVTPEVQADYNLKISMAWKNNAKLGEDAQNTIAYINEEDA
jgi:hypothetical protein